QERLLGGVASVLHPSEHPVGQVVYPTLVAGDEGVERGAVTVLEPGHQLGVGRLAPSRSPSRAHDDARTSTSLTAAANRPWSGASRTIQIMRPLARERGRSTVARPSRPTVNVTRPSVDASGRALSLGAAPGRSSNAQPGMGLVTVTWLTSTVRPSPTHRPSPGFRFPNFAEL